MSLRWKYLVAVLGALALALGAFVAADRLGLVRAASPAALVVAFTAAPGALLATALHTVDRFSLQRPLQRILHGARRLSEGDAAHRIEPGGGAELDAIAASINHLAEHAALSRGELEAQVAERTADLRAVLAEVHERTRVVEEVNRRLADLDKRRSEFLSNVSHELRTPLNSILGYLRLLQDGMYENEDERKEFLENARLSASHLLNLVHDVLSATQLEAGRLKVHPRPLHAGDVIRDVLRVTEFQAREKEITFRVRVDGRAIVLADEGKLRQVLVNLLSNAIKFTESGEIAVRIREEGVGVRFEVRDHGAGIPREHLGKIFEKFHQVDTPTNRAHGGTGMGLAICRQLVQLMGGSIGAESDGPGTGALLWFTLPKPEEAALAPQGSKSRSA